MGDRSEATLRFDSGPALSAEVLGRRLALPVKVAPVELVGRRIRLIPLVVERDAPDLYDVSNGQPARLGAREIGAYDADALVWRYMGGGPFADPAPLAAWLQTQVEAPNGLCLCVVDVATGRPVGVTNFMNNAPEHLKIELGGIWYSPLVQRCGYNIEAIYMMLRHAFELGYRRVEWKCDALNQRSRQAALGLGFIFEGIQEAHVIVKGRNRDTAWFRLLAPEWPAARQQLEARLGL